ncbi:MAG: hypothetical protein MZU97_03785 [Bacillus subtilis]|nr:hypothetical protein [Bacillus subtilis]
MLLTRFFSSEGMDLFPDMYLFQWPHFLYILFLRGRLPGPHEGASGRGLKVRRIVVLTSTILLLLSQIRRRGHLHLRVLRLRRAGLGEHPRVLRLAVP